MRKYLNNKRYADLLFTVCKSTSGLSRYNVFKEHHNDPYVYEMIDNLCPSHRKSGKLTKLFSIEDLEEHAKDSDFAYKILEQLDTTLGLKLELKENFEPVIDLKVSKSSNGYVVILQYKPKPPVYIPLEFKDGELINTSSIYILSNSELGEWTISQEYNIKIKQESGKHVVYYEVPKQSAIATVDFLDLIPSTPNDRMSSEESDVLVINVHGFLLLLLNLSKIKNMKGRGDNGNDKIHHNKWIHEVLLNPYLIDILPFLSNWKEFECEGFPVIDVLMEIAIELESQLEVTFSGLHSNNTAYLTQRATELYFSRVNNFFFHKIDEISPFWHLYLKDHDLDKLKTIRYMVNEYRVFILGLLKKWHEENLHDIKELISMYEIGKT